MQHEVDTTPTVKLPQQVTQQIDQGLEKFPVEQRQSAVIAALRAAQEHFDGWLSVPVMQAVADYLGMPAIAVFEVASFYEMFETAPVGKHTIAFCTGIACMLRGVDDVVDYAKQKLGIDFGQTTDDGMINLREVQCMGACDGAPMCQINHQNYHLKVDQARLDELLSSLQRDQVPSAQAGSVAAASSDSGERHD